MLRLRLILTAVSLLAVMFAIPSCTQSGDGPLEITSEEVEFSRTGYFLRPQLDSGNSIYVVGDSLYMKIDSAWTFSNCALKSITFETKTTDSTFFVKPVLNLKSNLGDCSSPYYRTDLFSMQVLDESVLHGVTQIIMSNTNDSAFDTISVRRGTKSLDTFEIYVDSVFNVSDSLPLRTKGSPSLLKVLDSITPLAFYWRSMKSKCEMKISDCDSTISDTLFPTQWQLNDTLLVPIRTACADSDEVYCAASYWKNDSSALGPVKEHLDTVWNTSLYLVESIPDCATYDRFTYKLMQVGYKGTFVRELFTPNEFDISCGPLTREKWMAINLSNGKIVQDSDSLEIAEKLYKAWKKAKVAPSKAKK